MTEEEAEILDEFFTRTTQKVSMTKKGVLGNRTLFLETEDGKFVSVKDFLATKTLPKTARTPIKAFA